MKEALVRKGPKVEVVESEIPKPGPSQVLIKVIVSGSNPKDWKMAEWSDSATNTGDDIAGIVDSVGSDVTEFKAGDRVAAFHEMRTPHGSFAEYALSWDYTTFHIPEKTSFEEAAALPLAALTAAVGLYLRLELPPPWTPATKDIPLVVYGASSGVGDYVVQFARRSNIHPIIAVAGNGQKLVETLIDRSKGDTIVDYRDGEEALISGIKKALGGRELLYAYDAISEKGSFQALSKILKPQEGKLTTVLPAKPEGVTHVMTGVGAVHKESKDFGFIVSRLFTKGLQEGWLKGHPTEVSPGGLAGIESALANLKAGKASAIKYVFKIADTPGVGK